jgi:hypothetical protein
MPIEFEHKQTFLVRGIGDAVMLSVIGWIFYWLSIGVCFFAVAFVEKIYLKTMGAIVDIRTLLFRNFMIVIFSFIVFLFIFIMLIHFTFNDHFIMGLCILFLLSSAIAFLLKMITVQLTVMDKKTRIKIVLFYIIWGATVGLAILLFFMITIFQMSVGIQIL